MRLCKDIYGNAYVSGRINLYDTVNIYGNSIISGDGFLLGNSKISGTAMISGEDISINKGIRLNHGHWTKIIANGKTKYLISNTLEKIKL
jgi:hypothetical protein